MFWFLVWGKITTIQLSWWCAALEAEAGDSRECKFSARHQHVSVLDLVPFEDTFSRMETCALGFFLRQSQKQLSSLSLEVFS